MVVIAVPKARSAAVTVCAPNLVIHVVVVPISVDLIRYVVLKVHAPQLTRDVVYQDRSAVMTVLAPTLMMIVVVKVYV